jgi:hypothetical protein
MKNLVLKKLTKTMLFVSVLFGVFAYTTNKSVIVSKEQENQKTAKKKAVITLPSIISTNTTLTPDNTYLLNGKVVVKDNATLTIQAGTRLFGIFKSNPAQASALIITAGSKINAVGTASNPIVFSGRVDFTNPTLTPGDWGGIVILGNAPTNRTAPTLIEGINATTLPVGVTDADVSYGLGTDPNDNSGVMSYVRVEYAGAVVSADNELNSFTFGGVGVGTTLDHLQAYRGADDAFEFFGGNVNAKYLISTTANDDAFDFDFGYSGKLQFLVAVLNPSAPYSANANGIESDNDGTGTGAIPITRPVISNLTIVGTTDGNTTAVSTPASVVLFGANIRRNSNFVLRNSILYGYKTVITDATPQPITLENNVLGLIPSAVAFNSTAADLTLPVSNSVGDATNLGIRLVNPFQFSGFFSSGLRSLRPTAAPSSTGATFIDADLSDPFFTPTTYKGAIPATNSAAEYWIGAAWVNKINIF